MGTAKVASAEAGSIAKNKRKSRHQRPKGAPSVAAAAENIEDRRFPARAESEGLGRPRPEHLKAAKPSRQRRGTDLPAPLPTQGQHKQWYWTGAQLAVCSFRRHQNFHLRWASYRKPTQAAGAPWSSLGCKAQGHSKTSAVMQQQAGVRRRQCTAAASRTVCARAKPSRKMGAIKRLSSAADGLFRYGAS